MASGQEKRSDLDARAKQGEIVVPAAGGTGGKSLEAQQHLAEGDQLGTEGCEEMVRKRGHTRKERLRSEGSQEMGRKGGLSTMDESGQERVEEEGQIDIDESK